MNNLIYALLTVPMILIIAVAVFYGFQSNIDRTGWDNATNSTFSKTVNGTNAGFNLATMLPFVLIAVTIIGVILGALVLKG